MLKSLNFFFVLRYNEHGDKMKEKRIQLVVGSLAVMIVVLGLILGYVPEGKNVQKRLQDIHMIDITTDNSSYTAKETFPIHVHTSKAYTITSTHGQISLNSTKLSDKKIRTMGDQVFYVKLNAKEDQTTIVVKNRWEKKTFTVKLENGYYLFQE